MNTLEVRFIRHASGTHMLTPDLITGHSLDAELTDDGKKEAMYKGYELVRRSITPDLVVSSSALRCIQTGGIILDTMGIDMPIHPTDELLEMDQGPNVGRLRAEAYDDEVQRQILEQGKDFALPGAESMNQAGARGFNWLRCQEAYAGQCSSILALAHGALISCIASTIEGWDQPTTFARLKTLHPVGETRVAFDGANWRLEAFAEPLQL